MEIFSAIGQNLVWAGQASTPYITSATGAISSFRAAIYNSQTVAQAIGFVATPAAGAGALGIASALIILVCLARYYYNRTPDTHEEPAPDVAPLALALPEGRFGASLSTVNGDEVRILIDLVTFDPEDLLQSLLLLNIDWRALQPRDNGLLTLTTPKDASHHALVISSEAGSLEIRFTKPSTEAEFDALIVDYVQAIKGLQELGISSLALKGTEKSPPPASPKKTKSGKRSFKGRPMNFGASTILHGEAAAEAYSGRRLRLGCGVSEYTLNALKSGRFYFDTANGMIAKTGK